MTVEIKKRNEEALIKIAGVLDKTTAESLERTIESSAKSAPIIVLDLSGIEHITSEGLLVLLRIRKEIKSVGSVRLAGVCESVMQIIEASGTNSAAASE
jgi:anti-sigma B factor antagonist